MTTITLPPEIEGPLAAEAYRQGTTPELLALDKLRVLFTPETHLGTGEKPEPTREHETLFDFLQGYVGTIEGTTEPLSENTGQRFAEGTALKYGKSKS